MFPAFKEWHVIIEALIAGEQILILRKGGIAEGRGGFRPDLAHRFWLFPTQFHSQLEKTKPAAAHFAASAPASDSTVTLHAFADVVHHSFLQDWEAVARLDSFHLWTEATVRERFDWSQPSGLHVFVVRVHRLNTPLTLARTPDMSGCKSWIELPPAFESQPSTPTLNADLFANKFAKLRLK
jgi:hypothetical protein